MRLIVARCEVVYSGRLSAVLPEAVRLLMDYAFNAFAANRVEIRCDELNVRSAAVSQRLGYVLEGRLRNVIGAAGGRLRTTLIYSLTPVDRT